MSVPPHAAAEYDYLVKILMIGDSGTGKSSLLTRFADESFNEAHICVRARRPHLGYPSNVVDVHVSRSRRDGATVRRPPQTIGVDFKIRSVRLDGNVAKLQIWDTAGQERFKTITTSYYRGAQGVLIVFDVASRASFDHVATWIDEVRRHAPRDVAVILVGNKVDLSERREVPRELATHLAASLGVEYLETSAKTDSNVAEAFERMARTIIRTREGAKFDIAKIERKQRVKLHGQRILADETRAGWCC